MSSLESDTTHRYGYKYKDCLSWNKLNPWVNWQDLFSIRFLEPISMFWGFLLTPTSNSFGLSWVFYNSTQYWHFLCGNSIWIHRLKVQSPRIIAKVQWPENPRKSLVQFIVKSKKHQRPWKLKAGRKKKRWIIPFSVFHFVLALSELNDVHHYEEDLLLSHRFKY